MGEGRKATCWAERRGIRERRRRSRGARRGIIVREEEEGRCLLKSRARCGRRAGDVMSS
jgi:hypothetical protein